MEATLFALVTDEAELFAFGMEITNGDHTEAVVYRRDPDTRKTMFGVHDSAERAKRHYSRMVPVDILWAPDDWENETV
ncbi:hypothetical protein [Umezawaea sp. NPDC059074]|uniref:hypothetical protein n=1 Tax=Umezawaea sp. NPDC059074 TaxID=3346716 RepID=UPI003686AEE5